MKTPWKVVGAVVLAGAAVIAGVYLRPRAAEPRSIELTETVRFPPRADGQAAKLWIPRPAQSPFQSVELVDIQSSWPMQERADLDFENPLLYFEPVPDVQGGAEIKIRYRITRREQDRPMPQSGAVSALFLGERGLVVINEEIRALAREAVGGATDPVEKAKRLYHLVLARMEYDKQEAGWGRGDVLRACRVGKGNCTDFHSLFIALARAEGIPARFQMGFPLPEESAGALGSGYHCWAEFHADGRGWIPVDISEAWKNPARTDYYFGRLDADRVGVSTGRELRMPGGSGAPLNYLSRPYAESGGKPVPGIVFSRRFKNIAVKKETL